MRASIALLPPLTVALALVASTASAATLQVGPGNTYAKPCAAIAAAAPGDTIEVDATGNYAGDTCVWKTDNLTVRGVGGRAKIDIKGTPPAGGKGVFVISAPNATLENFELSGSACTDDSKNCAGVRHEGLNLTMRNVYLHDNENGILGTPQTATGTAINKGTVVIEYSELARNGAGDGQSHNAYLNRYAEVTLRYSYTHSTKIGNLFKSRAFKTSILYSRLTGEAGTQSWELDIPNGGDVTVIGNLFQQSASTDNPNFSEVGLEGLPAGEGRTDKITYAHNTFVNDGPANASMLLVPPGFTGPVVFRNNLIAGPGKISNFAAIVNEGTCREADPKFVNKAIFDYRLQAGSPCIDKGVVPGSGEFPLFHYVHPTSFEGRKQTGASIDPGAYEFGGSVPIGPGDAGTGDAGASDGGTSGPGADDASSDADTTFVAGDPTTSGCSCNAVGAAHDTPPMLLLSAAALTATIAALRKRKGK
jgi:hypothetical protein